jgi:hypothetical protein
MMTAMRLLALATALWALQEPPARPAGAATDVVVLQDSTELRGEILELSPAGRMKVRLPGGARPVELAIEEIARLRFSTDEKHLGTPAGEQARLADGGSISGRIASFENDVAVIESPSGPLRLKRRDLKALFLGTPDKMPELRDDPKDLLIREVPGKAEGGAAAPREVVAEYGRLVSMGRDVVFQVAVAPEGEGKGKTEERTFDRASVKHIYFHRETRANDFPPGLFAKVTLTTGDRWVAVLVDIGQSRVRLFSHLFGTLELEKSRIHSLSFIQQAQLTAGNLLVTDQSGIHEFDAQKKEIWTYSQGCQGAAIARKLRNGNVLVADQMTNAIVELHPSGRTGGEVVWRKEDIEYPADVSRLENNNTLVVERYRNQVAEFDAQTHEMVWHVAAPQPLSAQRLDNGNTLITTYNAVFEVNRAGEEKWRADLLRNGTIRPYRAVRLDNGNTLITDFQKGQVVEIDSNSGEVWKRSGLTRPVQAIRLDDGNTLILEQGANRVIEVDPASPKLTTVILDRGLNLPTGIAIY